MLAFIAVLALTGGIELWMGRSPLGPDARFGFWEGNIWSGENSQRLADAYSFSHIVHVILFYAGLWLVARKIPVRHRLLIGLLATVLHVEVVVAQETVLVESNLVYGAAVDFAGSNVSLTLDAYHVNSAQPNRSVVILTHGGGFGAGDKGYTVAQGNFYPDLATAFA